MSFSMLSTLATGATSPSPKQWWIRSTTPSASNSTSELANDSRQREVPGLARVFVWSGSIVVVAASLTAAWTVALAYFARHLVYEYFPVGDEWALLANSNPALASPLEWFTSGFSDYFVFDPTLSTPYANFLRPSANLTY